MIRTVTWKDLSRLALARQLLLPRKAGAVAQTVLVDGFVAGTWRVEKQRVVVEALPGKKLTREVTAEAKRLEEWLA